MSFLGSFRWYKFNWKYGGLFLEVFTAIAKYNSKPKQNKTKQHTQNKNDFMSDTALGKRPVANKKTTSAAFTGLTEQ